MPFHTGVHETILFVKTENSFSFVTCALSTYFVAILYDALKYYRSLDSDVSPSEKSNPSINASKEPSPATSASAAMLSPGHLLQSGLHVLETLMFYCLMLLVMTCNVWLVTAVALGSVTGYFFFGYKKAARLYTEETNASFPLK